MHWLQPKCSPKITWIRFEGAHSLAHRQTQSNSRLTNQRNCAPEMNTVQFVKWVNLFCVSVSVYTSDVRNSYYKYYWVWEITSASLSGLSQLICSLGSLSALMVDSNFRLIYFNIFGARHDSISDSIKILIGEIRRKHIVGCVGTESKFLVRNNSYWNFEFPFQVEATRNSNLNRIISSNWMRRYRRVAEAMQDTTNDAS